MESHRQDKQDSNEFNLQLTDTGRGNHQLRSLTESLTFNLMADPDDNDPYSYLSGCLHETLVLPVLLANVQSLH